MVNTSTDSLLHECGMLSVVLFAAVDLHTGCLVPTASRPSQQPHCRACSQKSWTAWKKHSRQQQQQQRSRKKKTIMGQHQQAAAAAAVMALRLSSNTTSTPTSAA